MIAKGARSHKSPFKGRLEPLSHVQTVYYHKQTRDLQLLAAYPDLFEIAKHIARHAYRQVDQAEAIFDFDRADMLTVEACFVRDGPDDIARLNAMCVPDFDSEAFHV